MIDDGYDDLDYEEPRSRQWLAIAYKWLVGLGAIAAVVFGGMYLMNSGSDGGAAAVAQKGDIPLIQAAKGPVKVRPVNPGGRVVPHQGREVYREYETARRKGTGKTRVEDLLSPKQVAERKRRSPSRRKGTILVADGETCTMVPTLTADLGLFRTATWRLAAQQLNRIRPSAGNAKRDTRRQGSDDSRTVDSMAGAFRIQLGAFRSPTKAQKRWRGLKRKHRSLLGRLNMVIEKVNLGPRGTFYRLQAGPIRSERSARGLCRLLGRRRVNCILVSG